MKARKSLKSRISISILSVWLIVFVVQVICIVMLYNQNVRDAQANFSNTMVAAKSILESKINMGARLLDSVSGSPETVEYFRCGDAARRGEIRQVISRAMQDSYVITYEQFHMAFIDADGIAADMSDDISPQLLQSVRESYTSRGDSKERLSFFSTPDALFNEVYFCLFRDITIPSTESVVLKSLGTSIVVGKINVAELIRQSASGGETHLLLRNGVSDESSIVIIPKSFEEREWFSGSQNIAETGWLICGGAPLGFSFSIVLLLIVLETALMPILFFAMQLFIKKSIYVPINKIFNFLSLYSLNKKGDRIHLQNQTEIGIIADEIDKMVENAEKLSRRILQNQQTLYESEITQKDAMLYALQLQLSPHFLYNTLDCICGVANASGVPQIADATVALAKMLRYSASGGKIVSFFQEIEILESYLTILNIRQPNRFTVVFDVSEDAEETMCLKMLLQPLVENSFKHGFKEGVKNAQLIISAKTEKDCLIVKIFDNGRGIPKDKLDEILRELDSFNNFASIQRDGMMQIGLVNIHNRIRLNYGKDFGMSIKSEEGKFTEITLRLPRLCS